MMQRVKILSRAVQPLCLLLLALFYPFPAKAQTVRTDTVRIVLFSDTVALEEVTVKSRRKPAVNSQFNDLLPVELVTVGGACGDLYKAMQTLPGVQMQGESGKLLVRGGSSEETQTFIDGLHVLTPYTSGAEGQSARSRYSTFMFSGINMAAGGAPLEYGDALSAVLPLETKDASTVNKVGMNVSVVGVGGGGTHSFDRGSLSLDLNYQNLDLHNRLFPGRKEYDKPYTMASAATQWRMESRAGEVAKLYVQYDRTELVSREGTDNRRFGLDEDNFYCNATWKVTSPQRIWKSYAGVACSWHRQQIGGAQQAGDQWNMIEGEWHLKAKTERSWSEGRLGMQAGAEGFLRRYDAHYRWNEVDDRRVSDPRLGALFASFRAYPWMWLKSELSLRGEYASPSRQWLLSPRMALHAYTGRVMWSAVVGRYTQMPSFALLAMQSRLPMESCWHYNLGVQYKQGSRFAKLELYDKRYNRLAWYDGTEWTMSGHGFSRGVDLFASDAATFKRLEYQVSYTYNLSKRKAGEDPLWTTPQYATRHNASLVLKYSIPSIHLIAGLTNTVASGRPYHDDRKPGWMNSECKPYHSMDVAMTYLPSKKVILHLSVNNLLGRANEYGRADGKPVLGASDSFVYLGLFVTLGKKAAYDVSNF